MMKATFALLFLTLTEMATGEGTTSTKTSGEAALRATVLRNYDKKARPALNTSVTILSLSVLDIEMHERDHAMNVLSWFRLTWKDSRLQWDLVQHNDLDRLGMDPQEVWKPDLTIYNMAKAEQDLYKSELPVLVYPEGDVFYVPAVRLHFTCIMDLTYWPHDTHNCTAKIGSWVHNGHMMDIKIDATAPEFDLPTQASAGGVNISTSEWQVITSSVARKTKTYPCCPEPYVSVLISIVVRRDAPSYAWTVKTPAICLAVLMVIVFVLPPWAGEKALLGGLSLLLNLLFLAYTTTVVGHAPSHTPLIVMLASQQVVLVMGSVVMGALVVRLARSPHSSLLPGLMNKPLYTAAYFLCLSTYAKQTGWQRGYKYSQKSDEVELAEGVESEALSRERRGQQEWLLLAAVLDRLGLLLYLAICLVTLIRFSNVV